MHVCVFSFAGAHVLVDRSLQREHRYATTAVVVADRRCLGFLLPNGLTRLRSIYCTHTKNAQCDSTKDSRQSSGLHKREFTPTEIDSSNEQPSDFDARNIYNCMLEVDLNENVNRHTRWRDGTQTLLARHHRPMERMLSA
ncbi:hypothetical protein EG68_04526 [Paragonimus skrjabini miyazakii]|uniref:Uncharacterized protein n=1 Tax=Paragonimus skrjabini miyazakii TaxID=59628 RepID=A0A8S9YZI7_9TREM|nr:hypothetical protein EG68_04526 [Paragonimus skrjabini miyazakii]